MKFTTLLPMLLLITTIVAKDAYDSDVLSTRELEEVAVFPLANRWSSYKQRRANLLARAIIHELDNALYPRWGSGKYIIDDNVYHRDVKPKILVEMKKMKGFDKCGKNPDFHVERDGTVYPSSRVDKKGLCSKKSFSVNMHELLMSYVKPPAAESSPAPSTGRSPSPAPITSKKKTGKKKA